MPRPIKPEEKLLIAHLLNHLPKGHGYTIPDEVENMGETAIQLATRGDHTKDLVEATYVDEDRREVYITLTANQHGELFDLDLWKTDFNSLMRYPKPEDLRWD